MQSVVQRKLEEKRRFVFGLFYVSFCHGAIQSSYALAGSSGKLWDWQRMCNLEMIKGSLASSESMREY